MGDPGDTARVRVALAVALLGAVGAGVRPHGGLLPAAARLTPASCLHFTFTKILQRQSTIFCNRKIR